MNVSCLVAFLGALPPAALHVQRPPDSPALTHQYSGRSSIPRLCLPTVKHFRLGPLPGVGLVFCFFFFQFYLLEQEEKRIKQKEQIV